jgi:hypothetical protein
VDGRGTGGASPGVKDNTARRATQAQVRTRSVVRRRPARICGGLASLPDLASPVADGYCVMGKGDRRFGRSRQWGAVIGAIVPVPKSVRRSVMFGCGSRRCWGGLANNL